MKYLLTSTLLLLMFSCQQKKEPAKTYVVEERPVEASETTTVSDIAFERELDKYSIGGEGLTYENIDGDFQMVFEIATLERMTKQANEQLRHIETEAQYNPESDRQKAIRSMKMNLSMFEGRFCCTTHEGKHCEDVANLKKLATDFGCVKFRKKK